MAEMTLEWPNAQNPAAGLHTAGQPSPEQLAAAAGEGIRTVVNLCGEGECGWDEAAEVEDAGMNYVHIPVCGPEDICESRARELDAVLKDDSLYPMVVHCGSANRVGALFALRAFYCEHREPEEAIAAGRAAGLAGAEPRVRQCMSAASEG